MNVSFNLFGVPQPVVFCRQFRLVSDKLTNRTVRQEKTFKYLFNFVVLAVLCGKPRPSCTPRELKQMLKVVLPHDAELVGCMKEPCGFNMGKINERLTFFYRTETLRKRHSSHPLFAETKHGGYQCGGNDFF